MYLKNRKKREGQYKIFSFFPQDFIKQHPWDNNVLHYSTAYLIGKDMLSTCIGYTIKVFSPLNVIDAIILTLSNHERAMVSSL